MITLIHMGHQTADGFKQNPKTKSHQETLLNLNYEVKDDLLDLGRKGLYLQVEVMEVVTPHLDTTNVDEFKTKLKEIVESRQAIAYPSEAGTRISYTRKDGFLKLEAYDQSGTLAAMERTVPGSTALVMKPLKERERQESASDAPSITDLFGIL
jgi:hypothetical protein